MQQEASADLVIFGGGVAGLWLLNRLRDAGYAAVLFESGALGGGQTNKSQGIIHGGMKYALQAKLSDDARAMSDMPAVWQACLQGRGEIDLSAVPVLSKQHFLWAPNKFTAKLAGFFANAALKTKVNTISRQHFPAVFQHPQFKGDVYAMDEWVLDVPALVRELTKKHKNAIFKIEPFDQEDIHLDASGQITSIDLRKAGNTVSMKAQHFIFTAGAGNEILCRKLNLPHVAAQRRPLHMVLVKPPVEVGPLYGHCLGLGARPRLTITTHYCRNGQPVWYLGGVVAEEGVKRDRLAQIEVARQELKSLFPWIDFSDAEFSSFMIDRAEAKQQNGLKPESSVQQTIQNMTLAWPTKLALAPKLAADIIDMISSHHPSSVGCDVHALHDWPMPPFATPVWEDMFCV